MSPSRAFLMDTLPTSACVSAHACVSRSLFVSVGGNEGDKNTSVCAKCSKMTGTVAETPLLFRSKPKTCRYRIGRTINSNK